MVDQRIINTIKQYIKSIPKEYGIKKVFLFGSFARGNEKDGSDIDVALIFENMSDFYATQRDLMKLRRGIDLRIEPHPIKSENFNSSNPFAHEIDKTGIEISLDGLL